MKKNIMFVLFLSISVLLFSEENDKYDIELNLQLGETYLVSADLQVKMALSMMGMKQDMEQSTQMDLVLKVINKTAEGFLIHLSVTDFNISNGTIIDEIGEDNEVLYLAMISKYEIYHDALTKALENLYVELKISSKGEVLSLKGEDNFKEAYKESFFNIVDDEDAVEIVDFIADNLIREANSLLEDFLNFIPDYPVAIGESWELDLSDDDAVKLVVHFTLDRIEQGKLFINMKGNIELTAFDSQFGKSFPGWICGYKVIDQFSSWIVASSLRGEISIDESVKIEEIMVPLKLDFTVSSDYF